MATSKFSQYWTPIIILLVVIIVVGGIIAWARYSPSQPVEISIPPGKELQGKIYISGAVNNPGFYPLTGGDSIEALIQAAGGSTSSADLNRLKLYIPEVAEGEQPQKIDINRAEVWLLIALDGIGETKAQAIVDYREQNGLFRNINEITKIKGIGPVIYENIKHLITVAD